MKDLLVLVADADAEAFIKAVLSKPEALGVQPFSFEIMRHPQRDNGMVGSDAELVRMQKGKFRKALLLWDHHGSGRDHRVDATTVAGEIQDRLDRHTWSGNSAVQVFEPELEQWLWYCEAALADYCRVSSEQLQIWLAEFAQKHDQSVEQMQSGRPKELFEFVITRKLRQSISPRIFAEIGKKASINRLKQCPDFAKLCRMLECWFPETTAD